MDLVQPEAGTEDLTALCVLAAKGGPRVVLDLVFRRVEAPPGRVRVPPFGAHDDLPGGQASILQPGGEKGLGEAVRPSHVNVAETGVIGGVEYLVRAPLEVGDRAP